MHIAVLDLRADCVGTYNDIGLSNTEKCSLSKTIRCETFH